MALLAFHMITCTIGAFVWRFKKEIYSGAYKWANAFLKNNFFLRKEKRAFIGWGTCGQNRHFLSHTFPSQYFAFPSAPTLKKKPKMVAWARLLQHPFWLSQIGNGGPPKDPSAVWSLTEVLRERDRERARGKKEKDKIHFKHKRVLT